MSKAIITKTDVATASSFEEAQRLVREAVKNQNYELPRDFYQQLVSKREKKERILAIIGDLYDQLKDKDDSDSEKRKRELMDVANYIDYCIQKLGQKVKLVSMGESPDFTLEIDGELIGLEHTQIMDSATVQQVGRLQKICRTVTNAIEQKSPDHQRLVNLWFDDNALAGLKTSQIQQTVMEFVEKYLADPLTPRPTIISNVTATAFPIFDIKLSERYNEKDLNTAELDGLIKQKEAKLPSYQMGSGLSKIRLLVIVDGVSERSNPILHPDLLPQRDFGFDRITIYNTGKGEVTELGQ